MDRGAWWAAVHGVAKSQTRLSDFTFTFHFHALEKENGNPLQCSCLENPRDGGAWWAAVYGVAENRTQLKQLSSISSSSDGQESAYNARDLDLISGSGRSPREGNGWPLQYSCLENSMDRGAWWATVHGIAKSQVGLSN